MVKRHLLEGKNIGIVFGTYAPMHLGHIYSIHMAKKKLDGVVVIVSGYKEDRGDLIGLDLQKRFRYVREVFNEDELISVQCLKEDDIPKYPEGWSQWLQKCLTLANNACVDKSPNFTFFVGEKEYKEELNKRVPESSVEYLDRTMIPISATKIRENPIKYFNYIAKPFRRHFTKKVLIAGSASGGKTTLAQDLARTFNSTWSPEYAREYQETYNVTDDELNAKDYMYLLTGQYKQTSDLIESDVNNGLVIADTNSTVTKAYIDYYLSKSDCTTEEDLLVLNNLYESIVKKEDWDAIFIVLPRQSYVDDGFRDMTMAESDIRWQFTKDLILLFEKAGMKNKLVILGENPTEDFLYDNFKKAVEHIRYEIGFSIGK